MKMCKLNFTWSLLFICSIFKIISCSGIVEIRLLKFVNSGGIGANGHCCDGRGPFCFSDCDHKFTICIDNADGPNNIQSCPYYRKNSGEIRNSNTISFGSSIAGLPNPIKIPFESWPGELRMKVDVWDVDDNSNDHVDYLSGVFGLKASKSETNAEAKDFQIRRQTLLTYNVKVYCDEFYYGEFCDIFCEPSNNTFGHYTCDPKTGQYICGEGWSGEYCDENGVNECLKSPCNDSQTCINTSSGYDCVCGDGLTGPNCEESINATCKNDTCKNNGICEIVRGHVVCNCSDGYIGLTCDMKFDICANMQCHNNGTCVTELSEFICECPVGYFGDFCEMQNDTFSQNTTNNLARISNIAEVNTSKTGNESDVLESANNKTNDVQLLIPTRNTSDVLESSVNMTDQGTQDIVTTTQTVTTSTQQSIETTTFKKVIENKPSIKVRGRVDKNNKEYVGKGLRDLMYELLAIKDQLYLTLKYEVAKTRHGDIVSKIIINSAKDGSHNINRTLIQHILDHTPLSVIEQHIHMPVIREGPYAEHSHEDTDHDHSGFMHDYWYVIVILVIGVVCAIVAVGIFIIYKHKKLADPENKEEVPNPHPGISQPSSSQSFENSLYFELKKNNIKNHDNASYKVVP